MKYSQRDIVEINFLFPDGSFKPHPAVIVSNDELQDNEGYIYLCMISSKPYNPEYCYELDDEMLTVPMQKRVMSSVIFWWVILNVMLFVKSAE